MLDSLWKNSENFFNRLSDYYCLKFHTNRHGFSAQAPA